MPTDDADAAAQLATLTERLAAPPRPPADPNLFSSNALFGEPGIYPQGTPMEPASGPATTFDGAVAALEELGIDDAATRLVVPLGQIFLDPVIERGDVAIGERQARGDRCQRPGEEIGRAQSARIVAALEILFALQIAVPGH